MTLRRNRPLRGAIVGFGNVAVEGHLAAWNADRHLQLVAVCDADASRLAKAAELAPNARRHATLDDLLENERLDLVDVATPPATHVEIVLQLIAKRVNVLCEKPLALKPEDCNRIRARRAPRTSWCSRRTTGKPRRSSAPPSGSCDAATSARSHAIEIETLRTAPPGSADGATWRLDPALAGGGILVDHGWHAFYLALSMLDAEPVAVSARTERRKFTDAAVEDTARCTIEFPQAVAEIMLTWAADRRANSLRVSADHGTMEIADRHADRAAGGPRSRSRPRSRRRSRRARTIRIGSRPCSTICARSCTSRGLRGANFREAEDLLPGARARAIARAPRAARACRSVSRCRRHRSRQPPVPDAARRARADPHRSTPFWSPAAPRRSPSRE